jgi:hypothetical protein
MGQKIPEWFWDRAAFFPEFPLRFPHLQNERLRDGIICKYALRVHKLTDDTLIHCSPSAFDVLLAGILFFVGLRPIKLINGRVQRACDALFLILTRNDMAVLNFAQDGLVNARFCCGPGLNFAQDPSLYFDLHPLPLL